MTAFEIRLIAYLIVGLAYTGFISWGSVILTNHHRDRVEAAQRLAQDAVVQAQQQKTIDDLKAQQTATAAAEQKYADLKASTDGIADQLARSVSEYSSLRRSVLSAVAGPAGHPDAATGRPAGDPELTAAIRRATEACLSDAAELSGLQVWIAALPH